jgi:benzodiazapine receptor
MRYLTLALFLLFTVGGGILIGTINLPGEWYAGLAKPAFNPPNWIFGPVWTILYIMIAIAGWRSWERRFEGPAMQIWFAQLGLNFLWSPVFFSMHLLGFGLIIIIAMLLLILLFIRFSWNRDRIAAWLFVPYALWVAFASVLNGSLYILN